MNTGWRFVFALVAVACRPDPPPIQARTADAAPSAVLVATRGTPSLQGGLGQPIWHHAQATATFVDPARDRPVPHTEARASWDDARLYLLLYVADEDLAASDRVRVEFGSDKHLEVGPDRTLRCQFGPRDDCAALGVSAGFEVDGSLAKGPEPDEEWVATVALPWPLLAPAGRPAEVPLAFRRDDTLQGRPLTTVWTRGRGALRLQ